MTDESRLRSQLKRFGQDHLLCFWAELDVHQRARLVADIDTIDFDLLERHRRQICAPGPQPDMERYEVPDAFPALPTTDLEPTYARAAELGRQLIRNHRVIQVSSDHVVRGRIGKLAAHSQSLGRGPVELQADDVIVA